MILTISPAHAQTREQTLHEVERYLEGLSTIIADFMQVAPDGSLTGGKFFLQRPGKMRWQYDPPTPILMITTGKFLRFYDYELDQVSDIPLDDTLVGFLARDHIDFSDPALKLDNVERKEGAIRIALRQTSRLKDGSLLLEFTDQPIQLRNLVVTDAVGQKTSLSLTNAQFGRPLEAKVFEFEDPRKSRKSKKR